MLFLLNQWKMYKCHNNNIGWCHQAVFVKYQLIKYKTNKLSHVVSPQKCNVSNYLVK